MLVLFLVTVTLTVCDSLCDSVSDSVCESVDIFIVTVTLTPDLKRITCAIFCDSDTYSSSEEDDLCYFL